MVRRVQKHRFRAGSLDVEVINHIRAIDFELELLTHSLPRLPLSHVPKLQYEFVDGFWPNLRVREQGQANKVLRDVTDARNLLGVFEGNLYQQTIDEWKADLIVHAAWLRVGERCMLVPAESGNGKSSLCAAAYDKHRAVYGSDEFVAVRGTEALGLARSIQLKTDEDARPTSTALDAMVGKIVWQAPDTSLHQTHCLAPHRERVLSRFQQIDCMVLLSPKSTRAIRPARPSEILETLLRASYRNDVSSAETIARLASSIPSYWVSASSAEEAADELAMLARAPFAKEFFERQSQ